MIVSRPMPAAPPADGASGGPVQVELQFEGVGDLHQRWFGDAAIVTRLAEALSPCVQERAVVRMSWDEPTFTGTIRLYLDRATLGCRAEHRDGVVDLTPMEPVARALAAYRDGVANTFDLRVGSFKVQVEALDGTRLCRVNLGGQFPPDGSTWHPCVDLGGTLTCAGDAEPGPRADGVRAFTFSDPADGKYLAGCFGR